MIHDVMDHSWSGLFEPILLEQYLSSLLLASRRGAVVTGEGKLASLDWEPCGIRAVEQSSEPTGVATGSGGRLACGGTLLV